MNYSTGRYGACAGITRKGDPCRNTKSCCFHREANERRRREYDEQYFASLKAKQLEIFPRLTKEEIKRLFLEGYEAGVKEVTPTSAPCGCQG